MSLAFMKSHGNTITAFSQLSLSQRGDLTATGLLDHGIVFDPGGWPWPGSFTGAGGSTIRSISTWRSPPAFAGDPGIGDVGRGGLALGALARHARTQPRAESPWPSHMA